MTSCSPLKSKILDFCPLFIFPSSSRTTTFIWNSDDKSTSIQVSISISFLFVTNCPSASSTELKDDICFITFFSKAQNCSDFSKVFILNSFRLFILSSRLWALHLSDMSCNCINFSLSFCSSSSFQIAPANLRAALDIVNLLVDFSNHFCLSLSFFRDLLILTFFLFFSLCLGLPKIFSPAFLITFYFLFN